MTRGMAKKAEVAVRHGLVYPVLRFVMRNEPVTGIVDIKKIRSILILRGDGIGDMIVSTPMFRLLKQANPAIRLAVFASERNEEIIDSNPYVDRVYVLRRNWRGLMREVLAARREHYDVVLNFVFNRTTLEGILANLIAPRGVKVGQGLEKYRFYFNRFLSIDHGQAHMVEILAGMIQGVFGIVNDPASLSYDLFIDQSSRAKVDEFLKVNNLTRRDSETRTRPYMVINISAVDALRRMSEDQVEACLRYVLEHRKERPVIICSPNDVRRVLDIRSRFQNHAVLRYPVTGVARLLEIASVIQGASWVITPDTSIIHFASAMTTPVFALYTPTAARNHQWLPHAVYYKSCRASEGQSVASIPSEAIVNGLNEFCLGLEKRARLRYKQKKSRR